jgi:hypothetical protein
MRLPSCDPAPRLRTVVRLRPAQQAATRGSGVACGIRLYEKPRPLGRFSSVLFSWPETRTAQRPAAEARGRAGAGALAVEGVGTTREASFRMRLKEESGTPLLRVPQSNMVWIDQAWQLDACKGSL